MRSDNEPMQVQDLYVDGTRYTQGMNTDIGEQHHEIASKAQVAAVFVRDTGTGYQYIVHAVEVDDEGTEKDVEIFGYSTRVIIVDAP
jgi:hypothetical protein